MDDGIQRRLAFDLALRQFKRKVSELTSQAVDRDGRPTHDYVRIVMLKDWMRESHPTARVNETDGKPTSNIELLAYAAYATKSNSKFLPLKASKIAISGRQCCIAIFSILLDLGYGHYVDRFYRAGYRDSHLPGLELETLKIKLRGEEVPDSEDLAILFHDRKWKFCPAFFTKDMDESFFEHQVIPICRMSLIAEGGTAKVWQISVQAEFVGRDLKKAIQSDQSASYNDAKYGPCYLFALKVFEERNFHYFENEKQAFDGLGKLPGLIRRLGCYAQYSSVELGKNEGHIAKVNIQPKPKITKNLLLEFGTYDLRHIFGLQTPPVFPAAIVAFWKALSKVADAVDGIHAFEHGGNDFYGWHADIKPENIIQVRDSYKLADPGHARFKESEGDTVPPSIRLRGCTHTYGAPEILGPDVLQSVDIWSFGCVLSIAATWVILGYQGTYQYQQLRSKALEILIKSAGDDHPIFRSPQLCSNDNAKPESLDCFHNGYEVLSEVREWHNLLRNSCRKTDIVTTAIIDLVDQRILLQDSKSRITAKDLCKELKLIINSATTRIDNTRSRHSESIRAQRDHLEHLLRQIDKDSEAARQKLSVPSPEQTQSSVAGLPVNRSALNARVTQLLQQKTAHRFDTIVEPHSLQIIPEAIDELPIPVSNNLVVSSHTAHPQKTQSKLAMEQSAGLPVSPPQSPFESPLLKQSMSYPMARNNTGSLNLTRSDTATGSRPRQNIIQAHETIERERDRGGLGGFRMKGKPSKDGFLKDHFINRDITFLIDNAGSMVEHWDTTTFVLETLVWKTYKLDSDGPDLSFTKYDVKLESEKDPNKFRKVMQDAPKQSFKRIETNMKTALDPILSKYIGGKTTNKKQMPKDLVVIVLTDGLWTAMKDVNELVKSIEEFNSKLSEAMKGMPRDRQVTFQFIQFGKDIRAIEKLEYLDDHPTVGDVIDCERCIVGGDVFKMLAGSFIKQMDEEDVGSIHALPNSQRIGPKLTFTTT